MSRACLLLAMLAACSGDDGSGYPVAPGGGGSGSSMSPDAAVEDGDASTMIGGRVCLVADARQPSAGCATTGADGLSVTLGQQMATTAADGSFTIARPAATDIVWAVSGDGIMPSAMQLASGSTIPAISTAVYDNMLAATSATVAGGDGIIIARFTRGGVATAGVVVSTSPAATSGIYYDGTSAVDWELDSTQSFGAVWVPSIAPGEVDLTYSVGTSAGTIANVPVFAGTITFVPAALP